MMRIVIAFFCSMMLLASGCIFDDYYHDIGNGFKYGYQESVQTANVVFNSQRIFSHGYVFKIRYNDSLILAYLYRRKSGMYAIYDTTKPETYSIDKMLYVNNPEQEASEGVSGPLSDSEEDALLKEFDFTAIDYRE